LINSVESHLPFYFPPTSPHPPFLFL
jgi:histone acetyltransferase MYST1